MIRIAFRLDDPSLTSDHALELGILDCFRRCALPLTCAVVPFRCTDGKPRPITADAVPHLVDARHEGRIEVALHGYCHREIARLADGNSTEFCGIDPSRQRDAITLGKQRIEEVFAAPVTGFVPPWNSYDQATLCLLAELGFGYLSADWALVSEEDPPIPVLPHTCNLTHLEEAVTDARRFPRLEPILVVILHHFDFAESGSREAGTLAALQRLLDWVTAQPDLLCMTLAKLASEVLPKRCARNLRFARWRSGLHWRLQRLFPRYAMFDAERGHTATVLGRLALLDLPKVLRT